MPTVKKTNPMGIAFVQTGYVEKNKERMLVGFFVSTKHGYVVPAKNRIKAVVKPARLDGENISVLGGKDAERFIRMLDPVAIMDLYGKRKPEDLEMVNDVPRWFMVPFKRAAERFKALPDADKLKMPIPSETFNRAFSLPSTVSTLNKSTDKEIEELAFKAIQYLSNYKKVRLEKSAERAAGSRGEQGDYHCVINGNVLSWFWRLADFSQIEHSAFYWTQTGLSLRGKYYYPGQETATTFLYEVFLSASDKAVFKEFSAPGSKPAFFKDFKMDMASEYVDLSVSAARGNEAGEIERSLEGVTSEVKEGLSTGFPEATYINVKDLSTSVIKGFIERLAVSKQNEIRNVEITLKPNGDVKFGSKGLQAVVVGSSDEMGMAESTTVPASFMDMVFSMSPLDVKRMKLYPYAGAWISCESKGKSRAVFLLGSS